MKSTLLISFILLCLLNVNKAVAQRVLYAPATGTPSTTHIEVIGKAGDFYWVQKSKKSINPKKSNEPWIHDKDFSFEIYNGRLNPVRTVPFTISDTVQKEYLIAGDHYFDQLQLTNTGNKTNLLINRFTADGNTISDRDTLVQLSGDLEGNDLLLVRSADRSKLLLLGFESIKDAAPRLHTILFDSNWNILFQTIYKNGSLSQPILQYDFINYPLEYFDNSPVKLANNGDWLMLAPSRRNNNYSLFHFHSRDSSFIANEIKLGQHPRVQDLSLSLNNDKEEAFAGILLSSGASPVKKTRVAHYDLSQCRIDFDTTYWFNPLTAGKVQEENLYEQYFMPIPGKGFMFLKEYGRPYTNTFRYEEERKEDEAAALPVSVNTAPPPFNKKDYTRYSNLSGKRNNYDRGDLSLYFFPAAPGDSTWSGIINQEQTSDLNAADLSYVLMPLDSKLILLYNSLTYNDNKFSSTTILDDKGHPLNEGVVFWKMKHILDFQKARQILSNELAVPYEKNRLQGFAIIRLNDTD